MKTLKSTKISISDSVAVQIEEWDDMKHRVVFSVNGFQYRIIQPRDTGQARELIKALELLIELEESNDNKRTRREVRGAYSSLP